MSAPATDAKRIAAEILDGRQDGQGIDIIFNAIKKRFAEGMSGLRWRITFESLDLDITEDDITLAELSEVEQRTGTTWAAINPEASARHAMEIVRAVLIHRVGRTPEEATRVAGSIPANDMVDCISRYGVTPDPKGT